MTHKPIKKTKSLFSDTAENAAYMKPQNRFSEGLKREIVAQLMEWLKQRISAPYMVRLFSTYLCQEAIDKRIQQTSPRAANVLLSDRDKIADVVLEAKKIAQQLERDNLIDRVFDKLDELESMEEGNSI